MADSTKNNCGIGAVASVIKILYVCMWLELYTKDEVVEFLMLVLKQTFPLKQHTNRILWLMNTKPYKSVFSNILFQALFCRDQETLWWEPWLASQPNQL